MNVTRLLFPALGVAALLWAVQLSELAGATGRGIIELLPWIAVVLIAASWVGNSVFSPNLRKLRFLDLDDAQAALGRRLAIALGIIFSASMLLDLLARQSKMTAESLAVLNLPLILAGSFCLFKLSGLLKPKPTVISEGEEGGRGEVLTDSMLLSLSRVLLAFSVAAPILSVAGYFAASRYLIFPPILSLGLLGGGVTLFALIREGIGVLTSNGEETKPGLLRLLPVSC
jgi:potassium efflux system protein